MTHNTNRRALLLLLACPAFLLAIPVPERPPAPPDPKKFQEAIGEVLDGSRPLESVIILARWTGSKGDKSATLFGDGLALIDGEKQVRLSRKNVIRALELLRERGGDWLGHQFDNRTGVPGQDWAVLKVTIQGVSVACGGYFSVKSPEPFVRLVGAVLDLVKTHGQQPRGASSLADGLDQIQKGSLDPRTLTLTAMWRTPQGDRIFVCARWYHFEVLSRPAGQTKELHKTIPLTSAEMRSLWRLLQENNFDQIPERVVASDFDCTILRGFVLGHSRKVTIEPIVEEEIVAEVSRKPQGLANILAHLDVLARRTLREGK